MVSLGKLHTHLGCNTTLKNTRRQGGKIFLEALESRTLLSATLFVTPPSVPSDATHYPTLQAALAVAVNGDTVVLQAGFSAGSFVTTSLTTPASAGATSFRTAAALDVGDVVSIGNTGGSDPLERVLVRAVSPTGAGDFLISLATPLAFAHTGSTVDAANSSTIGPTIGLAQGITLTADAGVVLPFNGEIWQTATGVTLNNLNFTGGGNSLYVDGDGNAIYNVTVANQVVLTNAHHNAFLGITVAGRLTLGAGSAFNTVGGAMLAQVQLESGSHDNSFTGNTIGSLTGLGVGDSNGHDVFQGNTFTGAVLITGNTNVATGDSFDGNTFTASHGDALTLEHADGTLVQGNTVTDSAGFCIAIVVHNSANVVIGNNQVTTTGAAGTGVYAYSDGTGSTSVDINGNTLHTTDGFGVYLAKYDATAALEVRVQGNDLRGNAVGVYVFGDGVSAGNLDVGGGSTHFGSSTGGNNFSSFTVADASHYAIGLFATDVTFVLPAGNNVWGVTDPLTVVADATHTPAAFGTGIITAAIVPPPVTETITATANNLAAVQTGTTSGVVATFSSNVVHVAADCTATINWGDGTTSLGTIVANAGGGFSVQASHTWNDAGTFNVTVSISDSAATASAGVTATIDARTLAVQGVNFTIDKKLTFTGAVANFTDNLPGTTASSYVASVAWSDGVTTAATIVKNADGSFSIVTSRKFTKAGVVVASVSVGTIAGDFSGVASLTATITNKNDKVPPPFRQVIKLVRRSLQKGDPCEHAAAPAKACHGHS